MTKKLSIEGMTCNHCAGHVENALKEIDGVDSVEVNLEAKTAVIKLSKDVEDKIIKDAVLDAGYKVTRIE